MDVNNGDDSSTMLRLERLERCNNRMESRSDAARSALTLQGSPGAQTHGGQVKDRGPYPYRT